jgi:hypothetical protein
MQTATPKRAIPNCNKITVNNEVGKFSELRVRLSAGGMRWREEDGVGLRMSAIGPSRHFAAAQQLGRFWREADINRQAELAGLVANDPDRTGNLAAGAGISRRAW